MTQPSTTSRRRRLAGRRPRLTGPWVETSVLTVAVFLVLALWSLTTPLYSTVDEPRHINSVLRLEEGGGWPAPKTAPILEATDIGAREVGRPIGNTNVPGAQKSPGTRAPVAETAIPPSERSSIAGLEGPPAGRVPKLDWMNQHPPGFYALQAGLVKVVGADDWRWDHVVALLRLSTSLLTALAVPFLAGAARLVTRSRAGSLAGAASVLAIPQFFNVHSLVTNDGLLALLFAALLYLGVRALVRPATLASSCIGSGIVLGAALLTKGLALTAIPVVGLILLIAGWRAGRTWRQRFFLPLTAGILAFVIGGWWWVRNLLLYGTLQPSNFGSGRNATPDPDYTFGGYLEKVSRRLPETFWGSIRESLTLPRTLVLVATVALVAVVLVALAVSRRRGVIVLTFLLPALLLAVTLYHSWEIYYDEARIAGVQGRYVFSSLTGIALCVATLWAGGLRRRLTRPVVIVASAVVGVALVVVPLGAWLFSQRRLWPDGWSAMVDQGPLPAGAYLGVLAGAVVALALTALLLVLRTVVEPRSTVLAVEPEPGPSDDPRLDAALDPGPVETAERV